MLINDDDKDGSEKLKWKLFCWEIVIVYWANMGRDTRKMNFDIFEVRWKENVRKMESMVIFEVKEIKKSEK
jgi:hypothetical protein